jgi:hypothetical protein
MRKETEARSLDAPGRKNQDRSFQAIQAIGGWALLASGFVALLLVIGYTVTGGNALIFPIVGAVGSALLLLGLPAIWVMQPHTGRLGQVGLWCLGIGAGIALVVRVLLLVSTVDVGDLVPLLSAVFNLLGSIIVGWVTIRARVFPAAVGWLLIVGGVLNLLGGLTPAGLFTSVLGIVSGLAGAVAMVGYGWTIVGSTRHHSQAS